VFRRLGHVALILAVLAASGLHWNLLQTVAWTTMLADHLCTASFGEAIEKTFDGKHPCCLCRQIAAGKTTEKKSDFSSSSKKLEFIAGGLVLVFNPPQAFTLLTDRNCASHERAHKPPTPPPRDFFA
jgi:hypothetical protein